MMGRSLLLLAFCGFGTAVAQTTPAVPYQALTGSERWALYRDQTWLSPDFYMGAVVAAGFSQSVPDPPEWGKGVSGYGRRAASWMGVFGIEETVHHGGAALLGYDPRYARCGCKGFFRRSGHAIKWSLVTKDRAGRTRLDFPALAGAYGGGMLSTYWYPSRFQPLTDGVRTGTQEMGFVIVFHLIDEFTPEMKRLFTGKH